MVRKGLYNIQYHWTTLSLEVLSLCNEKNQMARRAPLYCWVIGILGLAILAEE